MRPYPTPGAKSTFFFLELFGPTTMPCATTQPPMQPQMRPYPAPGAQSTVVLATSTLKLPTTILCQSDGVDPSTCLSYPLITTTTMPPFSHGFPLSLSELGEPSTQTLTSLVTFGFGDEAKLQLQLESSPGNSCGREENTQTSYIFSDINQLLTSYDQWLRFTHRSYLLTGFQGF